MMDAKQIKSAFNSNLEVTVFSGHFATRHSHNTHYIDITRMKHEFMMAQEAAMTLAQRYTYEKQIDTIVCLDGSEIIGAFLAQQLSKSDRFALNRNKNINIVTPEYDTNGQLIFRDNLISMIHGKNLLLLISTVNSGRTVRRSVDCAVYYGGVVQGITSIFSALDAVGDISVYCLFKPEDIPGYETHPPQECPMCKAGQKIDALSNSYGFSLF